MDPSQFDQILLNLVVNARDAMTMGGTVTVSAQVDRNDVIGGAAPGAFTMTLRVADTGSGIAPDVVDHIFEPFYSTKGDRGTGLGLATVNSVVRSVHGEVSVASTIGVGSTFVVRLPALT
jgi:signal transduction histidine kinase